MKKRASFILTRTNRMGDTGEISPWLRAYTLLAEDLGSGVWVSALNSGGL